MFANKSLELHVKMTVNHKLSNIIDVTRGKPIESNSFKV